MLLLTIVFFLYILIVRLIRVEKRIMLIHKIISRKMTTYNPSPYVNIVKPIKKEKTITTYHEDYDSYSYLDVPTFLRISVSIESKFKKDEKLNNTIDSEEYNSNSYLDIPSFLRDSNHYQKPLIKQKDNILSFENYKNKI